ncbi:hypothetical protein UFOVP344_18 [uncultured Caudovirales phage]|uniref:Uncharacterized protein n=1 Tax=uncultured Caudovirales phage TaxID=2100421 RepID=A0A6J5M0Y1_9CAUD|nr:hypothetical protein UFOVP344_18 [uncultured Caudovirales phage]
MTRRRLPRNDATVLDAAVLLDGEIAYDTTNNELRIGDGVTAGGRAVSNADDLAASGGAALVGFRQAGTGAATRTSQDKMRESVSPLDFGAVGDGTTPDHAAFVTLASNYTSTSVVVDLQGKTYYIGACNQIPLLDTISYINGTFKVDSSTTITDNAGDTFGRWGNGIFWRSSSAAFTRNFRFEDVTFDIQRSKVNAIGGVACANTAGNTDLLTMVRPIYKGFAAGNNVAVSGTPGLNATESGGLIQLVGYSCRIVNPKISDAGSAIYIPNSDYVRIVGGYIEFSSTSRDFTKWHNGSAVNFGGTRDGAMEGKGTVYVTGGTAIFAGEVDPRVKYVRCDWDVIGAGLSAIMAGVRSYATSASAINSIDLSGMRVFGYLCRPDGDLHNGIDVVLEDNFSSTIALVRTDNVRVDGLAPWESWDAANGAVINSYNTKKAKGGDVGNGRAVSVVTKSGTGKRITRWEGSEMVAAHAPVIGVGCYGVVNATIGGKLWRCGWRKNMSNVAPQVQQSIDLFDIDRIAWDFVIEDHAPLVVVNNSFATPIRTADVIDQTAALTITGVSSQTNVCRVVNNALATNRVLRFTRFEPGACFLVDGQKRLYMDFSATATNNAAMVVQWPADDRTETITSAGYIGALRGGQANLFIRATYDTTGTLMPFRHHRGRRFEITVLPTANLQTVAVAAGETVDGSGSSITVRPGETLALISGDTEWTRVSATPSAAITAPTGGATVDTEARTAINAIRTALTAQGITV